MLYIATLSGLIILFNAVDKSYKKKYTYCIMCILMCMIMVLRDINVGTDVANYSNLFSHLKLFSLKEDLRWLYTNRSYSNIYTKAPGWVLFFKMAGSLFGYDYKVYIIVSSLFCSWFIFKYFWEMSNDSYGRVTILLYFLVLYLNSMNGVRTFMSIGLFMASSFYAFNKKYMQMIIYLLLAVSFHKIAVVGIVIDAVMITKWNRKRMIFISITGIVVAAFKNLFTLLFINIFKGDYGDVLVLVKDQVQGRNIVYQIAYGCMIVCFIIMKKNHVIQTSDEEIVDKLSVITFIEVAIGIVGFQTWYLQRINFFFQVYSFIMASYLFSYRTTNIKVVKWIVYGVFGFGFVFMIHNNIAGVMPYRTWIFNRLSL